MISRKVADFEALSQTFEYQHSPSPTTVACCRSSTCSPCTTHSGT